MPIACVLMFANYLFSMAFGLAFQTLAPRDTAEWIVQLVFIAMSLITLATAVWFIHLVARRTTGDRLRDVGWRWSRDSWWLALLGWAAMSTCMGLAQLLSSQINAGVRPIDLPERPDTIPLAVLGIIVGVAQGIALQGIPEELVFRGWLMRCLAHRPRLAVVVSSLAFGALHIVSNGGQQNVAERLLYCGHAAAFAFLAGMLALRLRSLWCAVGVHAGLHLTNLILEVLRVGHDGPTVWGIESALLVTAGLLLLRGWQGTRVEYVR